MSRNGGTFGKLRTITSSSTSGVWDLYDAHQLSSSNTWQETQKVVSVTNSNGTALNEETDNTITVTTSGVVNGTTLYYSVATVSGTTVTSADFDTGDVTGSFTVTSNSGSFVLRPVGDDLSESNVVKIEIRRGSTSGEILGETGNLTIGDAAAPAASCGSGTYTIFTSTSTNGTSSPNIMNTWYRRHLIGFCYSASELAAANSCFSSGATISGISFYISNPTSSSYNPYPNYAIAMCHITNGGNTSNPTSSTNRTNFTTVRSAGSQYFTATGTKTITFNNNFSYNGTDALGFIFAWGQIPTGYRSDGQSRIQSSGRMYYARTDGAGAYSVTNSASSYNTYRPRIDLICS